MSVRRHGRGGRHGPRRLHTQIHMALLLAIAVAAALAGLAGSLFFDHREHFDAAIQHHHPHHGVPWPLWMVGLFLALGLASYPVARRIAARIERMSASVQRFGAGDLSARVHVEGRDELAELATRWNEAASHIEQLVGQQRRVLASASHELRAPLARLRMALELLLEPKDPPEAAARAKLLEQVSADIEELDALVADVLLASRAQDPSAGRAFERIDVAEVVKAEAERSDLAARIDEQRHDVLGDRRMLARLVRNLLDNAHEHAQGAGIEIELTRADRELVLRVLDRGPGVPEGERERIFEPFYRPAGHRETHDGGVGLGLSLVADIARLHGGRARHLPREGGGSVLEVRLPSAAPS